MRISDWSSDVCSSDLEYLVHSRQGLGMAACNAAHQGPRTRRGTDLDVARVTAAAPLGDQAVALAALHQCNRRLVAGLQAFGQLADRAPAAPVEAVQVQQQQILRRRHALGARGRLAEVQELRKPEAELR